jgi:hypothetical protein
MCNTIYHPRFYTLQVAERDEHSPSITVSANIGGLE